MSRQPREFLKVPMRIRQFISLEGFLKDFNARLSVRDWRRALPTSGMPAKLSLAMPPSVTGES